MEKLIEELQKRIENLEQRVGRLEATPSGDVPSRVDVPGQPTRVDVAVFRDPENPTTATITQTQYAFADRDDAENPAKDVITQTQYAFSDRLDAENPTKGSSAMTQYAFADREREASNPAKDSSAMTQYAFHDQVFPDGDRTSSDDLDESPEKKK